LSYKKSGSRSTIQTNQENAMNTRKVITVLVHAFIAWMLCAATIGIGRATTSAEYTFVIHAILAPIIAVLVSQYYFKRYHYTSPLQTALIFVFVPMALDFFIVSLLILRSLDMFISVGSVLGTWIPLALIFTSTYMTGILVTKRVSRGGALQ
jgi:hypothetical protein